MEFADLEVIADRVYGVVLTMPMREDMKTVACGIPMKQELMRTSS